jgi:serine/threonine protein phosphatase PrpC
MVEVSNVCAKCGEPVSSSDTFCEACGARLKPAPDRGTLATAPAGSCRCGAPLSSFDEEGFCMQCGRKREVQDPRDHREEEATPDLAAVTDKGIRHKRNEDDFQLATRTSGVIIVVADGVSSASNSNAASRAACQAARDELLQALASGEDMATAVPRSVLRAHRAVLHVPANEAGRPEPPGTTLVSAVVRGNQLTVAWAGDSRAYWLGETQSVQLTKDHSWLAEIVEAGGMTEAEAEKDSRAHAITQCLGPLNEGPPQPGLMQFNLTEPGLLLVCTDGLWGYAKTAQELKSHLSSESTLENARHLVEFAIQKGGIDNITAALFRISKPI